MDSFEPSKARVAEHFNNISAEAYADNYSDRQVVSSPDTYFFQSRMIVVRNLLKTLAGETVVDIGCGPGIFARDSVLLGFRYHGIDISETMVSIGRKWFGGSAGVKFTVGDARHLPFPSNSIDVVLCLGMLEYVSKEEEAYYFEEIARVLKPGGTAIFSFLNAGSPHWIVSDYILSILRYGLWLVAKFMKIWGFRGIRDFQPTAFPLRKFRLFERVGALHASGFTVCDPVYFAPDVLPPYLNRLFGRWAVFLATGLERVLHKPGFRWLGKAFIVVAEKDGSSDQS